MPELANKFYVAEVRFASRAIFHDIAGRIVEEVGSTANLEDWVMQQGRQVILHNGGPEGALVKSSEQIIVNQFSFAYLAINPPSLNRFLAKYKDIAEKIIVLFGRRFDYQRVGARSVRFLPSDTSFIGLLRSFRDQYSKPELSNLFRDATLADIGFSVDYKIGHSDLHTACGPMKKEQAQERFFNTFAEASTLNPWSNIGIFFDTDHSQSENLPNRIVDIVGLTKEFFDRQEEAANRIQSQFAHGNVVA